MHKWLHSLSSTTEVTWVCCLSSEWRTPSTNIYLHTQYKIRLPTSRQKKEDVTLILPWKRVEAWHPLAARLSMLRWASERHSGSQKMTQLGTLGCNLHQSRKHWAEDTDKGITLNNFMLCFVLINSALLNLLCIWILFWNSSSHSCFRFLKTLMLCIHR